MPVTLRCYLIEAAVTFLLNCENNVKTALTYVWKLFYNLITAIKHGVAKKLCIFLANFFLESK